MKCYNLQGIFSPLQSYLTFTTYVKLLRTILHDKKLPIMTFTYLNTYKIQAFPYQKSQPTQDNLKNIYKKETLFVFY
jgi:hypothetical protein